MAPFSNKTETVEHNVMDLQRLRDAPVENEDAFQHIDDDMLAQVPIAFVLYRSTFGGLRTNAIPK